VAVPLSVEEKAFEPINEALETLKVRAEKIGAKLTRTIDYFSVSPYEALRERLRRSENQTLRNAVALRHVEELAVEYADNGNKLEAEFHAECVEVLNYRPSDPTDLNNIGYLSLALGKLDSARAYIERGLEEATVASIKLLLIYNLGMVEAVSGNVDAALEHFETCMKLGNHVSKREREVRCLMLPIKQSDGPIAFEEIMSSPDVLAFAAEAINRLK